MRGETRNWILRCLLVLLLPAIAHAEDANRPRGYLHFRSGEFDTGWNVHDYFGLSLGMNFDQHWGVELAGDAWERYLSYGELSINSIMPQARFRYPLLGDRLVPYAVLGGGPVFMQSNDARGYAEGKRIDGEGWRAGLSAGLGLEFFFNDSVAFVTEAKYQWIDSLPITVAGDKHSVDPSAFLASIGLRIYFDENRAQPLAEEEENPATRFAFGVRYGGGILTDKTLGSGLKFSEEPSAYGSLNQAPGMLLGANFGQNWGVDLLLSGVEPRLRLEGETVGEYATFSILPLARLRLPLQDGRWVPYMTAGFGAIYGEFNDGRNQFDVSAKGLYPAVAVGGGLEYFIHRGFSVTADTWWQYSWGHEFKVDGRQFRGDFSSLQLQLGFRAYLFKTKKKARPRLRRRPRSSI